MAEHVVNDEIASDAPGYYILFSINYEIRSSAGSLPPQQPFNHCYAPALLYSDYSLAWQNRFFVFLCGFSATTKKNGKTVCPRDTIAIILA